MGNTLSHLRVHQIIFSAALIIFTYTAYRSDGYYHADEHYQIIEYAGLRLGTHQTNEVAWEYKEQMRSGFQPLLAYAAIRVLDAVHITDPYAQMRIIRITTALLALLIIRMFVQSTEHFIDKPYQVLYYFLSYLLWFIPFLSTRFASETGSGLCFILGISLSMQRSQAKYLLWAGLAFGIAFLCRYQSAILSLAYLIWLISTRRLMLKSTPYLLAGGALAFAMGALADGWLYHEFVLSAWKYFQVTLWNPLDISFGTSPWYQYIRYLILAPSIPFGLVTLFLFVFISLVRPSNFMTWCFLPFIFIHSIIPHKEIRFLFPLAFMVPILLVYSLQELEKTLFPNSISTPLKRKLLLPFLLINVLGLTTMMSKSAGVGRMEITKYIHEQYPHKAVNLYYAPNSDPYNPWESLPSKFYQNERVHEISIAHSEKAAPQPNAINLLVVNMDYYEKHKAQLAAYQMLKRSVPVWISKTNAYYKGFNEQNVLMLYHLD